MHRYLYIVLIFQPTLFELSELETQNRYDSDDEGDGNEMVDDKKKKLDDEEKLSKWKETLRLIR